MARKTRKPVGKQPRGREPVLPNVNPVSGASGESPPVLPFPVVCAGASAGGLPALSQFLGALPADTGMAFVVVQHLEPTHSSLLSEILARDTKMPVREVTNGMPVEPDHVYVIPPGKNLVLDEHLLKLAPRSETRGQHRPIDLFMRSLAETQADRAIGVVLSGTASDGTQGLQEIKAAGGITFAQDGTAEHGGMPRSAIAGGYVDLVLPPAGIAKELARIAAHPYVKPEPAHPPESDPDTIARVLDVLRHASGVDFTHYKRNTLSRRIARRMVLHRLDGLADYVRKLQDEPAEAEALYQDILINVTSFFRDPEAYEALKTQVFPRLTDGRSRHEPVRAWALGCSTGEEAYSLAMAYTEWAEASGSRVPLQIFATDLNGLGIDKARAGIYPRGIVQDVSPERLRRFFTEIDGSYRVTKPIRDMCVFARQNALSDPPFSRLGLVACRNMLIYLDPVLQQHLLPVLHYSLQPGGFLWLGRSETINTYRDLFDVVDPQNRLYQRKAGTSRPRLPVPAPPFTNARATLAVTAVHRPEPDLQREAERALLARYSPPGVVLDGELNVVQFRGDTGAYLSPAPGRPTLSLVKMLREGLLAPVHAAVRKAQKYGVAVREEGLRVRADNGYRKVNIVVLPIKHAGSAENGLILLFEEPSRQAEGRARQAEAEAREAQSPQVDRKTIDREVLRLQDELAEMREFLQTVTEEHETTNEELQSANEEVQSANEELQSTNEELETSREEIQSSNEELATVNDELHRRNDDLQVANNDLLNLIGSVQMPIVILGSDLRIRRFTPAAEKVLNLIPADVGRPLADIRLKLSIPDLESVLLEVIETVSMKEFDVQDAQGRWYLLRVRPYRTLENKIDGAVLVLVDVDTIKRAEQNLRESDRRKNDFLAMLSHELRSPLAALRSAAQIVNAPDATEAAREQARSVMERQTRNMARMVDDLLDHARVSHGTIALRPAPMDLLVTVRQAVNATQHQRDASEQKIMLSLPETPLGVLADSVRLDQVLVNLLTNASRYTPRGGQIWVSVSSEPPIGRTADPHPAPHGSAVIRVRDNGIGIDTDMLGKVFDMYREIERAPAHARAGGVGLGLGLTLARTLVALHGGTIEVRSAGPSEGSEFTVRLPLLPPEEAQALAAAPGPAGGPPRIEPRRVLVVDDNADAAELLRVMLEFDGHEVRVANSGPSALAMAEESPPDLVLLDLGMPGMDGYAVAEKLRAAGVASQVVALSGYGRDEDLRRTRAAGFNDHLIKPVERRRLQALMAGVPAAK